jgi:hypothetical protein
VEISGGAVIKCSHESCVNVVTGSSLQSKNPVDSHTPIRDSTHTHSILDPIMISGSHGGKGLLLRSSVSRHHTMW